MWPILFCTLYFIFWVEIYFDSPDCPNFPSFPASYPRKSPRLTSNFFRTVTDNYDYDEYFLGLSLHFLFLIENIFPSCFALLQPHFPSSPKFSGSPKFSQDTITCNSDGLKNGHVDQYIKGGINKILTFQILDILEKYCGSIILGIRSLRNSRF